MIAIQFKKNSPTAVVAAARAVPAPIAAQKPKPSWRQKTSCVYFYSHEANEPSHVHVDRDDISCKFWLSPVGLASNLGFRASELRDIERLIEDNADDLLQKWEEFHVEPR